MKLVFRDSKGHLLTVDPDSMVGTVRRDSKGRLRTVKPRRILRMAHTALLMLASMGGMR